LTLAHAEGCEATPHQRNEVRVSNVDELQKRAVVLDSQLPVTGAVGDGGKVVVQAWIARIDRDGAPQKITSFGRPVVTLGDDGQIDQGFDAPWIGGEGNHEFVDRRLRRTRLEQGDAEIIVRLCVAGIDLNRATELPDRLVDVAAILIQQAKIVVDLSARFILFEKRAVLHQRVVEVADPLVVESQAEAIRWRRW